MSSFFDPYDVFGYLASGLLVVVGMELVLGFPRILGQSLSPVDIAVLVLAVYVAGQVVATPAKTILEDGLVEKILGSPSVNLFREVTPRVRGFFFRAFYKPLPSSVREKILQRAAREGQENPGENLFLHVRYSPVTLTNDKLMAKLDTFVRRYGFARNLAFTSISVGIALAVKACLAPNPESTRYAVTAIVVGILLLYRYLKFFRQYSYEMFNVYGAGE